MNEKVRDKDAHDDDRYDINKKVKICDEVIDELNKSKYEARKSTPDSDTDWEQVGAFACEADAKSKVREYFARGNSRCLGGRTSSIKNCSYYRYRCRITRIEGRSA